MKKATLLILLFFSGLMQAQLSVNNTTITPAQVVQNVLTEAGINPFNITFNGSALKATVANEQLAHFTTNANPINLGMNAGLLLTTGNAQAALGPNNSGSKTLPVLAANATVGDADLVTLAGTSIQNVAVLEFDFVATGTQLNLDLVFGSEEYPEFGNYSTDPFGVFLSGPGISGPFSGARLAKNIALVPNTALPISISTINPGMNSVYYVNNGSGTTPLVNAGIQYDGFTVPITLASSLQFGGSYHIKMALGNAMDNFYDSALFLKGFRIAALGLADHDLAAQMGLYPNPVASAVRIVTSAAVLMDRILIKDVQGRTVRDIKTAPVPELVIDLSECKAGLYFVEMGSNKGKAVKKFVKQ